MPTLKAAVALFLMRQRAKNLSPGTIKLYGDTLKDLTVFLASRTSDNVSTIKPQDLQAWLVELHQRGLSAGVKRSRIFLMKRLFAWLKARGELLTDPASDIDIPKLPDRMLKAPPNADTMRRVIESIPPASPLHLRDRALLELLYGSMLRVGEAMALNLANIDVDGGLVVVRRGKGGKDRVVPLPRKAADAVAAYLPTREKLCGGRRTAHDARHALFLSRRGNRLSRMTAGDILDKLGEETGVGHLHPHLLRHAGAVHMLRGGADIRHVQEILGHSQLETTKEYLRLVPGELKEAYDAAFPLLRV